MPEAIHLALIPDYKLKSSDPQVTSSFFRFLTRIKDLGGFFIGSKVKESGSKRIAYANTQKKCRARKPGAQILHKKGVTP